MKNGDNNGSDDDDEDDGGGIVANYRLWDERNAETVVTLVSGSADGHWDQIGEADFARDKKGGMANVFFSDGIEVLVFSIHIKHCSNGRKPDMSHLFLASQDALEVMLVSELLTLRTKLTDVTLVSEDTYWRLYWWDSGN